MVLKRISRSHGGALGKLQKTLPVVVVISHLKAGAGYAACPVCGPGVKADCPVCDPEAFASRSAER